MAFIVVMCVLIIAILLCVCCYLGVGIGTNCCKRIYTPLPTDVTGLPTTTTTTAVTTDTNMDYSAANAPSLYSQPPSVPYPAGGYLQQTPVADYPQENPPSYPLQPLGEYLRQQQADNDPEGYPIATSSLST